LILNEKIDLCISVVALIFPFMLCLDLKCSSLVLFPVSVWHLHFPCVGFVCRF
jgi:hypothetical protein